MWLLRLLIISLWTCSSLTSKSKEDEKSRQKRFLWMTQEKRLVLPPGTQLVLTPTLAMPLLRYPPSGLDANLTISTPFTRKNTHCFKIPNCVRKFYFLEKVKNSEFDFLSKKSVIFKCTKLPK